MTAVKKRRLFVAVKTDRALNLKIVRWIETNRELPIEWVPSKNLHLTLIPPWYSRNIAEVKEKLKRIEECFSSFTIIFKRIEPSPSRPNPQRLWLVGETNHHTDMLKKKLEDLLNVKPEKRKFLPHVTLARLKNAEGAAGVGSGSSLLKQGSKARKNCFLN